jgi:hypothetical protein
MTIQKDEKPWQGFNFDRALDRLMKELPIISDDYDPQQPARLESVILAFRASREWLADIELRLRRLHYDTLVKGWEDIADIVGVHKRTLQRPKYKKKLLQRGVIEYALIGDPPRKRIVGLPSRLVQERHRLRKKRKT